MKDDPRKDWRRQFISAEPALLVTDIVASREYFFRSLHFYCEGFTYQSDQKYYCQMFRGAAGFGLYQMVKSSTDTRRFASVPTDFCDLTLWLANLDEYREEIRADRPEIIREPYIDSGIKTMIVGSLDGHRLRLVEDQWRDDSWPPKDVT